MATVLLLIAFTIYWISEWGYRSITKGKKLTLDECFQLSERRGLFSRTKFNELTKQKIVVENQDGLKLHGYYIETDPNANKVVLLLHGYTRAFPMSMQFAELYTNKGFNILAIDQRAHGESEGTYTSYGYYEKYDIDTWIEWIRNNVGMNTTIGLHGISLGGGTALEYLHINQFVKFVIADCPYSDLAELIRYQIRYRYKAPNFIFYYTIGFLIKLYAQFRLSDVRPIAAVAKSELPILFIHGNRDRFIPTYMSKNLYEAKQKGLKRLWIAENAGHSDAYQRNRTQYEAEVSTFLVEALQLENYQKIV